MFKNPGESSRCTPSSAHEACSSPGVQNSTPRPRSAGRTTPYRLAIHVQHGNSSPRLDPFPAAEHVTLRQTPFRPLALVVRKTATQQMQREPSPTSPQPRRQQLAARHCAARHNRLERQPRYSPRYAPPLRAASPCRDAHSAPSPATPSVRGGARSSGDSRPKRARGTRKNGGSRGCG